MVRLPIGNPTVAGDVAGYNMAYPGAPISVYGQIIAHF